MTSEKRVTSSLSTAPVDYSNSYYDGYDAPELGSYSWESDHWRNFFTSVADRIVGLLAPATSFDVGCAKGLLVQALASRGVDAHGRDISEYAVKSAHADVRDRLSVGSATDPIEGRYDLITCVEVLEHMAAEEAQVAIDNMCAATDRILFSSTPADFDEPTHVNVHPTPQWAAWFAERGFYRRTDADVTFLATWAVLFERSDLTTRAVVERYEEQYAPLHQEVLEKRRALLEADRVIAELERVPREVASHDASVLARHAALIARDNVIGLEAQIGTLQNQLAELRQRIKNVRERLQEKTKEIEALRASRSWRVGHAIVRPAAWLKR